MSERGTAHHDEREPGARAVLPVLRRDEPVAARGLARRLGVPRLQPGVRGAVHRHRRSPSVRRRSAEPSERGRGDAVITSPAQRRRAGRDRRPGGRRTGGRDRPRRSCGGRPTSSAPGLRSPRPCRTPCWFTWRPGCCPASTCCSWTPAITSSRPSAPRTLSRRVYDVTLRRLLPLQTVEQQDAQYGKDLFARDPDLCCALRKVAPLNRALDRLRGVGDRGPAGGVADPGQHAGRPLRPQARQGQDRAAGGLDRRRRRRLHRRAQRAGESAARATNTPRSAASRAPAGCCRAGRPGRPVGRPGEDRMWDQHMTTPRPPPTRDAAPRAVRATRVAHRAAERRQDHDRAALADVLRPRRRRRNPGRRRGPHAPVGRSRVQPRGPRDPGHPNRFRRRTAGPARRHGAGPGDRAVRRCPGQGPRPPRRARHAHCCRCTCPRPSRCAPSGTSRACTPRRSAARSAR